MGMETAQKSNLPLIVMIVVIIVVAVFAYLYFTGRGGSIVPVAPTPAETGEEITEVPTVIDASVKASEAGGDLGSEIFEKASNPVADEVPGVVAPTANPLEGVFTNPFE